MEAPEPTQLCDNCSQPFPESKINSHFSYCRRNIKKCAQCSMMVDINYQQEHNDDYHKLNPCKFCKVQFKGDELSKHEGTCKSKPKYCQYCQLNIGGTEFDRHVVTCGSRTNTCPKCQKHVMLKELAVHETTCRGKVVEPSPPPMTYETFKRREVRPQVQERPERIQKPERSEKPERAQKQYLMDKPTVRAQLPSYPNKVPSIVHKGSLKQQQSRRPVEPVNPNSRFANVPNTRFTSGQRVVRTQKQKQPEKNKYLVQPTRNYKREEPKPIVPQDVPRRRQEPRQEAPQRQQTNTEKLYRQQKQLIRKVQKQRIQKHRQEPYRSYQDNHRIRQPVQPSHPSAVDMGNEDLQLQRALMESAQMSKPSMDFPNDFGMTDMSQSFYRDVQQQKQIEARIKKPELRY